MNKKKSELYLQAKQIKRHYKDCYSPISNFTKSELLHYIYSCNNTFREPTGEDILTVADSKICNRSGINSKNQRLFDAYIFSGKLDTGVVSIGKANTINIRLATNTNIYKRLLPKTKDLKFNKIKKIGSGTYGYIFSYYNFEYNIEFAFKKEDIDPHYDNAIEERISNLLNDNDNKCDTIRVKYIRSDKYHSYYILNKLEGDLSLLVSKLNNSGMGLNDPRVTTCKLKIADKIRHQIVCLYNLHNDLIYTDVKLENILYGCHDKEHLNEFKIHLGDLGSAVKDNDGEYMSTYLPYEFAKTKGIIHFENPRILNGFLAWVIGLVLLALIDSTESDNLLYECFWNKIKDTSKKDFRAICNKIADLVESYYKKPELRLYFKFNNKDRPDINRSLI